MLAIAAFPLAVGLLGWAVDQYAKLTTAVPSTASSPAALSPPDGASADAVFVTTPDDLIAAYEANGIAVDDLMRGKIVRVSGTVQTIGRDMLDHTIIQLRTLRPRLPARLTMADDDPIAVGELSEGQAVVIDCASMRRATDSPAGSGCHVASVRARH